MWPRVFGNPARSLGNPGGAGGLNPALAAYRTALAARSTTPVNIVALGTSITEGWNITTLEGRWVALLRDKLRTRHSVTGGQSYIKAWYSGTPTPLTEPWTLVNSPSTNTFGLGGFSRQIDTTKTMAYTFTGTSVRVYYTGYATGGHIGVQIDSGSVVDVSTVDAAGIRPMKFYDSPPVSSGSHTVTISAISGTSFVDGVLVLNGDETNGIRMFEGGKSAQQISYYTAGGYSTYFPYAINKIQPSLVLIESPVNEWFFGTSAATWITNLTSLVATIRAQCTILPSICMVFDYERGAGGSTGANTWQSYRDAAAAYVASDGNIAFCDMDVAFGKSAWNTGLIDTDHVHPTPTGAEFWATTLDTFLAR